MKVTAKIDDIHYNGYTFEVSATIEDQLVTFWTTHPTDEELLYHCRKQYELITRCRSISSTYKEGVDNYIGKTYDFETLAEDGL